ncbi:ribbon-helix-helix domain-containing protein [Ensifer adhaerens]|uniref:ribbon-helix-helix domain-containing protein n=1 Tax=Ensifer adhaerens TaxID=106592 RepID=UPI003CFBD22D
MSKRPSLTSFAPHAQADSGKVVASQAEPTATGPAVKYPKVTVYLDAQEIRTLKLLSIDSGEKVSDICSRAIREWMERNGHARSGNLTHNA